MIINTDLKGKAVPALLVTGAGESPASFKI
jgi:hypothetical protein